jgi:poly-beta-1,6-N-acetyl-D-glucosamine synthase
VLQVTVLAVLGLLVAFHVLLTWFRALRRGLQARQRPAPPPPCQIASWPSVSIILPAWQEAGMLPACLRALRAVDYPGWEAILVAGGPDGTYALARSLAGDDPRFQVIEQQPAGKNAALNAGFRLASGGVIVLLDADSLVEPGWLSELVRPLAQGFDASTGNYFPARLTPISLAGEMEKISAYLVHQAVTLQGSGGIALRRWVVEELGGFPESVLVGVDWDLDARLARRGVERAFCERARLRTDRPAALPEWWRNELRWRRAHFRSLFRLRDHFLRDLRAAVSHLYIYALAWFSLLFTLSIMLLVLLAGRHVAVFALSLWALFAAWLLLRCAALAAEVAAFTGDRLWLRLAWAPPLLLCLALAACCAAAFASSRRLVHFRGSRGRRLEADGS